MFFQGYDLKPFGLPTDGRTHERTDGRTNGRTDGRTDGRTELPTYISKLKCPIFLEGV